MSLSVEPVRSRKDRKEFIQLPYRLYKNFKAWVPPLISEIKTSLDINRNPFYSHALIESFLARLNGKIVGRIAAIIDRNFIDIRDEAVGQFGFFDSIDNDSVAKALFNTASSWLREQGMVKMLGPTNPSMNDELGVLINTFEIPPAIKMVWNPPYYPALYEEAGFSKAMDLWAWKMDKADVSDRMIRAGQAILKRARVKFRHPDMKKFDQEIQLIREIYNEAWSANWGFVPWTEEEFEHVAKSLKQVIDPNLVLIAEVKEKTVGFSLALPDLNVALGKINGRLFPFGLPLLLWHSRKIHQARILILGVTREYRNRGIDTAMYYETFRISTEKGYDSAEMSWVLENNDPMNKALKMMGAHQYKTYRLYERPL